MAKKHLRTLTLLLAAFAFASVLLIACARPGTAGSASSSGTSSGNSCTSGTTVKTGQTSFETTCITFAKGGTLQVVQDQTTTHILDFGQWNGSNQAPETPAGAPPLKDLTLSGPSVSIGPFTTAGTFHIYCTIHVGMNLTVIVK